MVSGSLVKWLRIEVWISIASDSLGLESGIFVDAATGYQSGSTLHMLLYADLDRKWILWDSSSAVYLASQH